MSASFDLTQFGDKYAAIISCKSMDIAVDFLRCPGIDIKVDDNHIYTSDGYEYIYFLEHLWAVLY